MKLLAIVTMTFKNWSQISEEDTYVTLNFETSSIGLLASCVQSTAIKSLSARYATKIYIFGLDCGIWYMLQIFWCCSYCRRKKDTLRFLRIFWVKKKKCFSCKNNNFKIDIWPDLHLTYIKSQVRCTIRSNDHNYRHRHTKWLEKNVSHGILVTFIFGGIL